MVSQGALQRSQKKIVGHSGVENLSGLAIKAQVDSPGTALTVGGWLTTAEKKHWGIEGGPK